MSKFTFNIDGSLASAGGRPASVGGVSYDEYLRAQQDINLLTSRVSSFQTKVLDLQGDINQIKALTASGQVFPANTLANAEKALVRANTNLEDANADLAKARAVILKFENSQSPANLQTQTTQTFDVIGPPGATVEQAREIFNRQRTTGSLVGLKSGEVIDATKQAAGGLTSAIPQISTALGSNIDQNLLTLGKTTVTKGINAASFVKQAAPNFSLGPLNPSDIQGLMAQTAAMSGQKFDQVSAAGGVGKFGFSLDKLETTGVIKPGTAQAFAKSAPPTVTNRDIEEAAKINAEGGDITPEQVARNRQLNSFLSPAVFTGKMGVSNLNSLLTDENLQNKLQGDVLKQSYQALANNGLTGQITDPTKLAATLQTAASFDLKTAESLVKGLEIKNISEVKEVAKSAEFAKNFSGKFADVLSTGGPLDTGIKKPTGSTNTVDRTTVNAALTSILGNAKIPVPKFAPAPPEDSTAADVRLTYTGTDPIVWDRVNGERIRSGLPGLADIGLPRPE